MLKTSDLNQFTGSLEKTRFGLMQKVIATEGVMHLAKEAKAFWLLDVIASYMPQILKDKHGEDFKYMSFWKIKKLDEATKAIVTGDDGNGNVKISQEIEYTDFWLNCDDEVTIYAQWDEQYVTLMLPSEY